MGWVMAAAATVSAVAGGIKAISANKKAKEAAKNAAKAKIELDKQKEAFKALDTSNPYLNLENTAEDLTVNTQAADFQKQQSMQSQANIMGQMKGAAGGSGIAALAQSLASQGSLDAQKASASIGAQEQANQQLKVQEASRIQGLEREGELISRQGEFGKISSLMGMSADEMANYQAQENAMNQQVGEGLGEVAGSAEYISQMEKKPPASDRKLKKDIKQISLSPSGLKIYSFEYIDESFGKGAWQGVMSDEIPQRAVIKHEDGYDRVDYSQLDVEFKQI